MLYPTCICGRPMEFRTDQTKTYCKTPGCGVVQERGPEGYWAYGRSRLAFTPILAKLKLNHYQRYMAWRKAGSRC